MKKHCALMANFILMCLTVLSSAAYAQATLSKWTVNEIAILLPLPQTADLKEAIPLSAFLSLGRFAEAVGQPLLSPVVDKRPFIMSGNISGHPQVGGNDFDSLFLVSLRIDPCFKFHFKDLCQKQIRLVWQPLETAGDKMQTIDGAVHTFYNLDDETFAALLSQLEVLNGPHKDLLRSSPALNANPVLAKYGYHSDYYRKLRTLILDTVNQGYFSRMALMELHAFGEFWDFFAVDFDKAGNFTQAKIPNFAHNTVEFSNILQMPAEIVAFTKKSTFYVKSVADSHEPLIGKFGFKGTFGGGGGSVLKPTDEMYLASPHFFSSPIVRFLQDSEQFPTAKLPALQRRIDQVNNPKVHLAGTVDCVSCHATQPIRAYLNGRRDAEIKSFHAFGYFIDTLSISQRTRAEAAESLKILNQN